MNALQDITNRNPRDSQQSIDSVGDINTFLTQPSENIYLTRRSISLNNLPISNYVHNNLRINSPRRIRFPSRLRYGSINTDYIDRNGSSDFELHDNLVDDCFHQNRKSNSSSSFDIDDYNESKEIIESAISKRKRLSLPTVSHGSKILNKFSHVSQSCLAELMHDVSSITLTKKKVPLCKVEYLKYLLQNIHKAMPDRVYGSTRDAVCYKRVEVHLKVFKFECLTQCRMMFNKCLWEDLIDYVLVSWNLVSKLPYWENESHNLHKQQMFSIMASYCRKCFRVANLNEDSTKKFKARIIECCKVNNGLDGVLRNIFV